MKSIVAYVRSLLGWCDEDPAIRTSFKRDRVDDEFSSDDEEPVLKRLKQLKRTSFPDSMSNKDVWERKEKPSKNVRYIPIQVETGHPSTSTPNEISSKTCRGRNVPLKLVDVTDSGIKLVGVDNGPSTPIRKPRMHTPVRPVIHAVVDDDDDDEQEVTFVQSKQPNSKKPSKVYINLDDEENENDTEDDVIFVKKVQTPSAVKPYSLFVTKNKDDTQYYRLSRKLNNRDTGSISPRTYSKFKAPPGITKTYKRVPTPIPRWMQVQKVNGSQTKNKSSLNGNIQSTLSELYNLNEKRNYQELIRRVGDSMKPLEVINLAEDAASFRNTQQSQKRALNEIKLLEKGLSTYNDSETTTEYDPITVASINSSDSEVEVVPSESSSSSVRIDPINTLRDSFKDKAIISDDWLSKFNKKYRKLHQETQDKVKEARRECDIISKVNSEQKIAHLEHKLKYELSIPESLFEEPQPTVELPKLTPEQERLVDRALGPGPAGQMLVEKFNLRIHRRDLQTLAGLNWLNDEVINFYMNLLMQRSEERPDLPRVYATNTFFYPKLMQSGQAGLRRWTRKVDIFAHELMVVPVHLGVHWCLSLVEFSEKRVVYLDSMGGRNQRALDAILQYLRDEHQDKKGQPFDDDGWRTECLKDIPQQMNGSDCGMFACTFAEFSSRGAPYTFSQAHMPALRRKAVYEILTGRLLL